MTEQVTNNLFKGMGDCLIDAGKALGAGNATTNNIRAAYNQMGCFGYGYGCCGGLFPVPGLDATDISIRSALGHMYDGLQLGNTGGAGGFGGAGATDSASSAPKTTNEAACFSKLSTSSLSSLAKIESDLKAKKEKLEKTTDEAEKKALAKDIEKLEKDYKTAEGKFAPGKKPSEKYGTQYDFYSNLSEEELKTIQEKNGNIEKMKKDAEEFKAKALKKVDEVRRKQQEVIAKGGNPADVKKQYSQAEIDEIDSNPARYEEMMKDIEKEIEDLESYIKEAGKDGKTIDFSLHRIGSAETKAAEAKKNAPENTAKSFTDNLYDNNGALKSKADVRKAMLESAKGKYTEADVDTVLDIMYSAAEGKDAKGFKEALASKEFFKSVSEKFGKLDGNERKAELFKNVYEKIAGTGSLKANAAKVHSGFGSGLVEAATRAKVPPKAAPQNPAPASQTRILSEKELTEALKNVENGDIDGLEDDAVVQLLLKKSNDVWNKASKETRGKIAIKLNEIADAKGLDSRLYVDEDMGRAHWYGDGVKYYKMESTEVKDETDVHLIASSGQFSAEEIGKKTDDSEFKSAYLAIARDISKVK